VPSDAKFTDTTYTLGSFGITATAAELNHTDGVTSNIQTQLNNRSEFIDKRAVGENAGKTEYYKLFTITPNATYDNSNYEVYIASRTNRIAKMVVYTNSGNDKYLSANIYYEGNNFVADNIKGFIYKDTTNATSRLEVWCKVSAWNDIRFYEKTLFNRSVSVSWNMTKGTAFPTNATTTVTPEASPWYGNAATATNVAWSGVTSKPSYYDAKAIKGITRSGTTFTYTCMDGTTGTFTQQDNNTTYSAATTSAAGLMSAADKSKLDGIATGANKYTLPTASSSTLGGVKTTSTVTSTSGLTACPIISGVPYYKDTNTTYNAATTTTAGLMSAADKTKLNGLASVTISGSQLIVTV
jgi:hypothetical protein